MDKLPARQVLGHLRAATRLALSAAPGTTIGYAAVETAAGALPVVAAWLVKMLFDRLGASAGWPDVLPLVLGMVIVGGLAGLVPAVMRYLNGRLNRRIAVIAMSRLYEAAGRLTGMSRIEDPAFRDRLRMAQQAGRAGPGRLLEQALGIGRTAVTVTGFLASLIVLNPWVALVAVVMGAPALVAQLRLSRARAGVFWQVAPMERREMHYAELLVSVPAAKEVRLLGLSDLFRGRMVGEMLAANLAQDRQDGREARAEGMLALLAAALNGASLLWAVWLATRGQFSVGDVSVFIAAVAGLQLGMQSITALFAGAHEALLLFHHYREIERAEPDLPVPAHPRPTPPLSQGIELTDVWFRYAPDKPWVLRGVRLTLRPGRAVALVGLNGAGKSTLIKLLCRFYDPTRGTIRWDGTDLREMDPRQLRERIGAVFQDYMEYDLSAAENIGVGDLSAFDDRSRIVAAARRADAHDMLSALPNGYDTLLSKIFMEEADTGRPETGMSLSGGQWQRVALARAFMRERRDLMILDEPNAGLDAEAEHETHRRLRGHRAGVTLLVSHRLAAVRDADDIVVLSEGRVSERGNHDTLIAAEGLYARLFHLQADGYAPTGQAAAARPR